MAEEAGKGKRFLKRPLVRLANPLGVKSNVNARLFKWSLQISVLKDKVTIVHRLGRLLRNVDPLSRNTASYHVTLIHISDEWKGKLTEGYQTDPVSRRVLLQLKSLHLNKKKGDPLRRPQRPVTLSKQ